MSVENLISAISDGNYSDAEDAFENIMANKVTDALDAKRLEISKNMFASAETNGTFEDFEAEEPEAVESEEAETEE